MEYFSTRDSSVRVSAQEAIARGISKDGGLLVPAQIPQITPDFIEGLRAFGYAGRALRVLSPWLPDFSEAELDAMLTRAYQGFDAPDVAPLARLSGNRYLLELWHGPTLAFKDMALQLMPHLLAASAKKVGETREILILVATSGDTGKAALEGFKDAPGMRVCVFYPEQGVSEAQRLQMVTQEGENTHVVAVKGNFDDAQTGVKKIFADQDFIRELDARGMVLSSANSINLGRLLPQIAYYFSAYADLRNQNAIQPGEVIDVCVPTGNFGNILAAHYARAMGLPIGMLVCASNANNVLSDFIQTGVYDANRRFHQTTSPSMDILISSNLERMLSELTGPNDVVSMMQQLKASGRYALPDAAAERLRKGMWGAWADEAEVTREIKRCFTEEGYLLDPHTAVAQSVLSRYQSSGPCARVSVTVSTASPFKFGRAVLAAIEGDAPTGDFLCCEKLGELSGWAVPDSIRQLPKKRVRHTASCEKSGMLEALRGQLP